MFPNSEDIRQLTNAVNQLNNSLVTYIPPLTNALEKVDTHSMKEIVSSLKEILNELKK